MDGRSSIKLTPFSGQRTVSVTKLERRDSPQNADPLDRRKVTQNSRRRICPCVLLRSKPDLLNDLLKQIMSRRLNPSLTSLNPQNRPEIAFRHLSERASCKSMSQAKVFPISAKRKAETAR